LNFDECDDVEQELLDNRDLLRAYIILRDDLRSEKMSFDQKIILESINDFIIEPRFTADGADLIEVRFGEPSPVRGTEGLYQL
jgi:hypothetical protein